MIKHCIHLSSNNSKKLLTIQESWHVVLNSLDLSNQKQEILNFPCLPRNFQRYVCHHQTYNPEETFSTGGVLSYPVIMIPKNHEMIKICYWLIIVFGRKFRSFLGIKKKCGIFMQNSNYYYIKLSNRSNMIFLLKLCLLWKKIEDHR